MEAGLVSREGARRYGVVIKPNGSVDEKATTTLRARMAKKRGKTKLFDFGGTIAELKKSCKKETGLEPPIAPVFQTWVKQAAVKSPAKAKAKGANGKSGRRTTA